MKYIVLDTNILYIDYEKKFHVKNLYFSSAVLDLLKMRDEGRLGKSVEILIPEIVVRELMRQKLEDFNRLEDDVKQIRRCIDGCGTVEVLINADSYDEVVKKQFVDWMAQNAVEVLPTCEQTYFEKIIDDAIEKRPPFEGRDKKSDKGFKDTVIFYSIISYAKRNKGDYFLWTYDSQFSGNTYRNNVDYFKAETGCDLKLIKNCDDMVMERENKSIEFISNLYVEYVEKVYCCGKMPAYAEETISHLRPVIKGGYDIVDKINGDIDKVFEENKKFWNKMLEQDGEDIIEDFFGELEGKVTYNEKGILCVQFVNRVCLGGVANPEKTVKVYDLNTGRLLKLTHILRKTEEEVIDIVIKKQKEDSIRFPDKYWSDFVPKYERADDIKYYINSEGLFIFFDVYEASCGADGNVSFKLLDVEQLPFGDAE